MITAETIDLVDARQAADVRDWLQKAYPLYLNELSEFDAGSTLDRTALRC